MHRLVQAATGKNNPPDDGHRKWPKPPGNQPGKVAGATAGSHRKERKIHMKYEIYQLKEDTMEQVKLRFMASDQAAQLGGIHRENYRRVYGGEIPSVPEVVRMLLRLFALFNGSNRPVDFSGHSMSVSDIVRLTEDGASSWWYCDPYGWMELNGEEWGQT
jgi:hypothetical protein